MDAVVTMLYYTARNLSAESHPKYIHRTLGRANVELVVLSSVASDKPCTFSRGLLLFLPNELGDHSVNKLEELRWSPTVFLTARLDISGPLIAKKAT